VPEFVMDSDIWDLSRDWYLKAGTIYTIYFLCMIILHPLESFIYWAIVSIRQMMNKKKITIQKKLNKIYAGVEFDYSHKIGRLMAHAAIAIYHGAGLPILYLFFMAHFALFMIIEKALMLKFYRKLEHQAPYFRQYIIHVLLVMLLLHLFRTVDVIGAEDVFPDSYSQELVIKSGTLLYVYLPKTKTYFERLVLKQGIGYFLFIIFLTIHYALIWWSHRKNFLGKILGWSELLTVPRNNPVPVSVIRDRNLAFKPDTYDFFKLPKYKEAVRSVDRVMFGYQNANNRPDSPEKSVVESQYDLNLKSEANSGDEIGHHKDPNLNIYNRDEMHRVHSDEKIDQNRADSDGLEEYQLK
jgi:hypothetical protein